MLDGAGPAERPPNVVELAASLLFPRHAASTSVASNTPASTAADALQPGTQHQNGSGQVSTQRDDGTSAGAANYWQQMSRRFQFLPSFGVLLCLVPLGSGRTAFASAVGSLPESAIAP